MSLIRFAKPSGRFEDLVCGFIPDEGLGIAVVVFDEVVDSRFEFAGRAVDAAPNLAFLRTLKGSNRTKRRLLKMAA